MGQVREKRHRLPGESYKGRVVVSFTSRVTNGAPFMSERHVRTGVECLARATEKHSCSVLVYCFMPNHLHALIKGENDQADAKTAFDLFKQLSGFALKKEGFTWQKDYYDHIVSQSEDLQSQAVYIAANPIRAGLAIEPGQYFGTGAIGLDLADVMVKSNHALRYLN